MILKKAKRSCNKIEKEVAKTQNAFVEELMEKKAKDCKVSVETLKKQLSREKKQEK